MPTTLTTEFVAAWSRGTPIEAPVLYLRDVPTGDDVSALRRWRELPDARVIVVESASEPWRTVVSRHVRARALIDAHLACFHAEPTRPCWCWAPRADVIAEAAQRLRTKLHPGRLHPRFPAGHSVVALPSRLSVLVSDDESDRARSTEAGLRTMTLEEWRTSGTSDV